MDAKMMCAYFNDYIFYYLKINLCLKDENYHLSKLSRSNKLWHSQINAATNFQIDILDNKRGQQQWYYKDLKYHLGKSATIRESNHGSGVHVKYIMRSTMYPKNSIL